MGKTIMKFTFFLAKEVSLPSVQNICNTALRNDVIRECSENTGTANGIQ
jgi:hypothetical protein